MYFFLLAICIHDILTSMWNATYDNSNIIRSCRHEVVAYTHAARDKYLYIARRRRGRRSECLSIIPAAKWPVNWPFPSTYHGKWPSACFRRRYFPFCWRGTRQVWPLSFIQAWNALRDSQSDLLSMYIDDIAVAHSTKICEVMCYIICMKNI